MRDTEIPLSATWREGSEPLAVNPHEHCRMVLTGIPGSPGVALGPVFLHTRKDLWVDARSIEEDRVEREIARFKEAVSAVVAEKRELQRRAERELGINEGQIFESHIMLLEDSDATAETINRIRTERKNAEYCYYVTLQKVIDTITRLETHEYLRDRVVDIEDIRAAVLGKLSGQTANGLEELHEKSMVVTHVLTPSDTARMQPSKVIGFVTETGGPTSHASILARSMGIPAVVGCTRATASVYPGETVILNGFSGQVYVEPDEVLREQVALWREEQARRGARLDELSRLPSQTRDGHRVRLELNIELPEEIAHASICPSDGVGLFRTEFLFLSRHDWPSEDEQYAVYAQLAGSFSGRPVTIRTMDIGGDKLSKRLRVEPEMNPFLGWRAIRISLAQPDLFRVQMRAILRASAQRNVRLMFPMITSLDEFRRSLEVLREAEHELEVRGESYDPEMPVGVMIETPAAVMVAEALAEEADFFSIGTNDLVQYTIAVDRDNEHVAELFDIYHPAIVRLIHATARAAHNARIDVSVCGEMAHEPLATMLLVGLGVDSLSMAPGGIPEIRHLIRQFTLTDAKEVARQAMAKVTGADVRAVLRQALADLGIGPLSELEVLNLR